MNQGIVWGAFSAWMVPAFFGWGIFGFLQWLVLRSALRSIRRWIFLSAVAGSLGIAAYAGAEMLVDRYEPPKMWGKMFGEEVVVEGEETMTEAELEVVAQGGERDPVLWIWGVARSLLGGLMGLMQWTALRSCASRAWLWLVATPVSWAAGAMLVGMFGGSAGLYDSGYDWGGCGERGVGDYKKGHLDLSEKIPRQVIHRITA